MHVMAYEASCDLAIIYLSYLLSPTIWEGAMACKWTVLEKCEGILETQVKES